MNSSYSRNEIIINAREIEEEYFDENLKIGGKRASFSEHFQFKRIGVHYFSIPSGYRTSRPHAEKCEDEFVFVISGTIDCWVNGRIKRMQSGESIGFPAGTGIGHTFINNSSEDVELFVVGERTKAENQYYFHLEPELQSECGVRWWADIPSQSLGEHDGMPGEFKEMLLDNSISTIDSNDFLKKAKTYNYPGDEETFGLGLCLSREFQINTFAVWLERLPAEKRSSWPHAHSIEEEFVFILINGRPTLWLNEQELELENFDGVDFKAGSGLSHAIYNKSDQDLTYLCIGECAPLNDLIFYPLHPKRNEEVKSKGGLWEDCPYSALIIKNGNDET